MIKIFDYPKVLYDLELQINEAKAEINNLQQRLENLRIQALKAINGQKFKSEQARIDAVLVECSQHDGYSNLIDLLGIKQKKLDDLKAKHGIRRRELRILETEYHQGSGITYLPTCYEDTEN